MEAGHVAPSLLLSACEAEENGDSQPWCEAHAKSCTSMICADALVFLMKAYCHEWLSALAARGRKKGREPVLARCGVSRLAALRETGLWFIANMCRRNRRLTAQSCQRS